MTSLMIVSTFVVSVLLPLAAGFSTGPLINTTTCTDMFPSGHGATAQTGTAAYKVVTPGNCYKAGQAVPVYLMLDGEIMPYFEGLMAQAREVANDGSMVTTGNVGSWSVGTDTTDLKTSDCFSNTNSVVHHQRKDHWACKRVDLMVDASVSGTLRIEVTAVRNKATFWTGLTSHNLTQSDTCTHDISNINCDVTRVDDTHGSAGGSDVVRPLVIAHICLAFMSLLMM